MTYFNYTEQELAYLKEKDPKLKQIIEKVGLIRRNVNHNFMLALSQNIIGQQISTKALNTIWSRFLVLVFKSAQLNHNFGQDTKHEQDLIFKSLKDKTTLLKLDPNLVKQELSTLKLNEQENLLLEYKLSQINSLTLASIILQISDLNLKGCGISQTKIGWIKNCATLIEQQLLKEEYIKTLNDSEAIKQLVKIDGIGTWTAQMLLMFCFEYKDIFSFNDSALKKGLSLIYKHDHISKKQFDYYKDLFSPYGSIASFYLWEISNNASYYQDFLNTLD